MEVGNNQLVLDLDPEARRRLAAAAALKGVSVRRYCLSAIDRELTRDEASGSSFVKSDHESFAELRQEIFKGKPLPGNSVDLPREAREIGDGQADSRGFDRQAFERLVKLRREMFKGKPLAGNSVDLLRDARDIRGKEMDGWQ